MRAGADAEPLRSLIKKSWRSAKSLAVFFFFVFCSSLFALFCLLLSLPDETRVFDHQKFKVPRLVPRATPTTAWIVIIKWFTTVLSFKQQFQMIISQTSHSLDFFFKPPHTLCRTTKVTTFWHSALIISDKKLNSLYGYLYELPTQRNSVFRVICDRVIRHVEYDCRFETGKQKHQFSNMKLCTVAPTGL